MKSCAELCVYMNGKWSLIRTLPKEPLIRAVFFILIVVFRSIRFGSISSVPREASEMFQCIKYEDKREVFGFKIHSFSTLDRIKKYDDSDNGKSAEKPYSIEVGEIERTINLYAIATTKFQVAV